MMVIMSVPEHSFVLALLMVDLKHLSIKRFVLLSSEHNPPPPVFPILRFLIFLYLIAIKCMGNYYAEDLPPAGCFIAS